MADGVPCTINPVLEQPPARPLVIDRYLLAARPKLALDTRGYWFPTPTKWRYEKSTHPARGDLRIPPSPFDLRGFLVFDGVGARGLREDDEIGFYCDRLRVHAVDIEPAGAVRYRGDEVAKCCGHEEPRCSVDTVSLGMPAS